MHASASKRRYWLLTTITAALFAGHTAVQGESPSTATDAEMNAALQAYYSANGLLNRGLYDLAVEEYRKFLSEYGGHDKADVARYGLGVSLFRLGRHEQAAQVLSAIEPKEDFGYAVEVATILGQCYLALDEPGRAADAFDQVREGAMDHPLADDAVVGAAEAYYLAGEYKHAVERSRALVARWPKSPLRWRAAFFRGLAQMAMEDYESAAEHFLSVVEKDADGPFASQASLLLAQCYHRSNALERAAKFYRKVIDEGAGKYLSDALVGLGMLQQQVGKPQEALELLERVDAANGEAVRGPSARYYRARALFDVGRFDAAFDAFAAVAKQGGDLAGDAAYWLAKCRLRQGDPEDAAARLRSAIDTYDDGPWQPEMRYDLAVALARARDFPAAVKELKAFRRAYPEHAMVENALHLQATCDHQRGAFEESLEACDEFLKTYHRSKLEPAVRFLRAENLFLAGDYHRATKAYERFLKNHPTNAQHDQAVYRLGTAWYRMGKLEKAAPLLAEIVQEERGAERFTTALLALGDIHFQRSEWKLAERFLDEYVALGLDAPNADDALLKLGLARQRQQHYDKALTAYERLLKRWPDSPHRWQAEFERGQTLLVLDRLDDARSAFQRIVEQAGDSRYAPFALNHLGTIAMRRGDFEKAADLYKQSGNDKLGDAGEAEAQYQQGQALLAAGKFAQAEQAFSKFLEKHPKHERAAQASAHWAIALARQDRFEDALSAVERVDRKYASKLERPLRAAVQYEKAWCLHKLGRDTQAAKTYRSLLVNLGDGAAEDRAAKSAHGGRAEDDLVDLKQHAMLDLATIEANAGNCKEAVDWLEPLQKQTRGRKPSASAALTEQAAYQLAVCQFELGRFEASAAQFEDFLNSFPKSALHVSGRFFCGEALYKLGRNREAVKHLTHVVEVCPSDSTCEAAMLRLGQCLTTLQHWPKAERVFATYLDRFGDHEQWFQARFGVGWARENQGRYDDAIRAYEDVVERHQGSTAARAQFQIGESLFAKKQYDEAVRAFLKVDILYAYPEWSAAALYEAAQCFEKLGKFVEARNHFKTVVDKFGDSRWAAMASQRLAEVSAAALPGG